MANNNHIFEDEQVALCGVKLRRFADPLGASTVDFGDAAVYVGCDTCVRLAFELNKKARLDREPSWFEIGYHDAANNQNNGKEVNMKNQAQLRLRVFFSEDWVIHRPDAEAILNTLPQTVLLKDERQHQAMALLFCDLLEEEKIPDSAQYIWVASPSAGKWDIRRVVKRERRNKIGPTGFDKPEHPIVVVTFTS